MRKTWLRHKLSATFLKAVENSDKIVIIDGDVSSIKSERLRLTSDIKAMDFGCDHRDGACFAQRGGERHCCDSCSENLGHFRRIPRSDIEIMEDLWDPENGFLGENGCRIPFEDRSSICIIHKCKHLSEHKPILRHSPSYRPLKKQIHNPEFEGII